MRRAIQSQRALNILTMPLDGAFEHTLARGLHHNFYVPNEARSLFNNRRPLPNLHFLLGPLQRLPIHIDYDLIIGNNRLDNRINVAALSHQLHLPIVFFEHSTYNKQVLEEDIQGINNSFKHAFVIYTSKEVQEYWDKDGVCVERARLEQPTDQLEFSMIDSVLCQASETTYIRK